MNPLDCTFTHRNVPGRLLREHLQTVQLLFLHRLIQRRATVLRRDKCDVNKKTQLQATGCGLNHGRRGRAPCDQQGQESTTHVVQA